METKKKDCVQPNYSQVLDQYTILWGEVCTKLEDVTTNLKLFFQDIKTDSARIHSEHSVVMSTLEKETLHLKENVKYLVGSFEKLKNSEKNTKFQINALNVELDKLQQDKQIQKKEIDKMQRDRKNQNEEMEKIQRDRENQKEELDKMQLFVEKQKEEIEKLQNELENNYSLLLHQTSFCATLGSTMGNFLWRATKEKSVVQLLLTSNKMNEYLAIASGSILSFIDSYKGDSFPGQQSNDMQFIITLIGTITNILAYPDGRKLLTTSQDGITLITQLLNVYPSLLLTISSQSADLLKRSILMALFNVSISQSGLKIIQQETEFLVSLVKQIDEETSSNHDLTLMALKLLYSIVYEIMDENFQKTIQSLIPMRILDEWEVRSNAECRSIIENIKHNLVHSEQVINPQCHEFQ